MSTNTEDLVIGEGDVAKAQELHQRGMASEAEGDRIAAIAAYREAVAESPLTESRFRLAWLLDLMGEEEEAISLYQSLAADDQPHINSLINLAILLEDRGEYDEAMRTLRPVLESNPNHPRARMFQRDCEASESMLFDEDTERDQGRFNTMLDTPVTDFELSVRARNCLKKMNIRTLGDLLKVSEAELLSYRNFGETSLVEIKNMLASKGLRLGQGVDGQLRRNTNDAFEELKGLAPDHVLNKPISSLDLSVRARKALQLLGIGTVGDLAMRTEAELMGVKNFGSTSLDEIKERLELHNLSLRKLG
ncbi:MAG: DNA-directed RNA polymerase subunit alpha C-terminal domain-containing protein [Planctomycetota bacterium]|jgi:DNA-directed RNA polymerase subunit alpha|nr:DNA-directed RNA polymerase subunit alpha C-terminal domain-containing protein [Planctomycetota bacterium]|tara:strand:+ start:519 stop:1436 length:918 start_codon:yes stop_codon:yes gene_type:complete